MKTAISENSPAFHAGFATGVLMDRDSDRRQKIDAEIDSMDMNKKTLFLMFLMLQAGDLEIEDGQVFSVDSETGSRKLIA